MTEDQIWVTIARALPAPEDPDPTTYWRASRDLAERDVREWVSAGEAMYIQLARVRESDLSVDDHGFVTTPVDRIDWGNLEVVPGLNAEEFRAVEVLRDAEIDPEVLAHIVYELCRHAAKRTMTTG